MALPLDPAWVEKCEIDLIRHVGPFCTPLVEVLSDGTGRHRGSGTFVTLADKLCVLTCDHVIYDKQQPALAVSRGPATPASAHTEKYCGGGDVLDVGIIRLAPGCLDEGTKQALPQARIAERFSPTDGELLFIYGFPGFKDIPNFEATFSTLLDSQRVSRMAVLRPVIELPPGFDPEWYFAMHYSHKEMIQVVGEGYADATPHGMSGAAVWDSQMVSQGVDKWKPADARLVGMQFKWIKEREAMVCLKIEIIRQFISRALQLDNVR